MNRSILDIRDMDFQTETEGERWKRMKMLRAEGHNFTAMVPVLVSEGLLDCQTDHRQRKRRAGAVCATCENTIFAFWKRHIGRLTEDERDMMEERWRWREAHEWAAKLAREKSLQNVVVRTIRRTWIEPGDDSAWTVTIITPDGPREAIVRSRDVTGCAKIVTETERHEMRIYPELIRVAMEAVDKLAKMAGIDLDDPDAAEKTPRGKVSVERADAPSDGGTVH